MDVEKRHGIGRKKFKTLKYYQFFFKKQGWWMDGHWKETQG
jgi:hypothetical protein